MLDGEVVVLDERGRSSFQLLQQLGASRRGLAFFAFDLLALDGEDLKPLPLEERKRRLETLIGRTRGHHSLHAALRHGRRDGPRPRVQARRGGDRQQVPHGALPGRDGAPTTGRKPNALGARSSSSAGSPSPKARAKASGRSSSGITKDSALRFAGKVGTGRGWNDAFGRKLRGLLESIEVDATPFDPAPPGALARRAHWVEPRLVAEVQFTEWTGDGKIRHPSLQGFRTDKRPTDVRREREAGPHSLT